MTESERLAGLEAAVYARPDDDEVRLVYGDACASAGAPRGEVIALQARAPLSERQRRRLAGLIARNRRRWLGPLHAILDPESLRFRLGFLDGATLESRRSADIEAALGDDRWRTLRALQLGDPSVGSAAPLAALVAHPWLAGLRALTGKLPYELVLALSAGRRPLRRLGVWSAGVPHFEAALHDGLRAARGLPALAQLDYRTLDAPARPEGYGWLLESALGRRLRVLDLSASFAAVDAWTVTFAGGPWDAIVLAPPGEAGFLALTREEAGVALNVWVEGGRGRPGRVAFAEIAGALHRMEPAAVAKLRVGWPRAPRHRPNRGQLEALHEAGWALELVDAVPRPAVSLVG